MGNYEETNKERYNENHPHPSPPFTIGFHDLHALLDPPLLHLSRSGPNAKETQRTKAPFVPREPKLFWLTLEGDREPTPVAITGFVERASGSPMLYNNRRLRLYRRWISLTQDGFDDPFRPEDVLGQPRSRNGCSCPTMRNSTGPAREPTRKESAMSETTDTSTYQVETANHEEERFEGVSRVDVLDGCLFIRQGDQVTILAKDTWIRISNVQE